MVRIGTVGVSANGSVVIQSSGRPSIAGCAGPTSNRRTRAVPSELLAERVGELGGEGDRVLGAAAWRP
jgi:hypothetical protein